MKYYPILCATKRTPLPLPLNSRSGSVFYKKDWFLAEEEGGRMETDRELGEPEEEGQNANVSAEGCWPGVSLDAPSNCRTELVSWTGPVAPLLDLKIGWALSSNHILLSELSSATVQRGQLLRLLSFLFFLSLTFNFLSQEKLWGSHRPRVPISLLPGTHHAWKLKERRGLMALLCWPFFNSTLNQKVDRKTMKK